MALTARSPRLSSSRYAAVNQVYREFFADCPRFPARTTVVTHLVREGVRVEIDGVAALAR
ncbi:RidA family protein [Streptomyces incarnatus]|uniref:RidA family protein n=1 Tax=Streptomyces incarnatus TaxID=665007 RepID=UPI001AD8493A|nr:RidA family protein [Streptomyces incarnatus]